YLSGVDFQNKCFPGLKLDKPLSLQQYYDVFMVALQKGEIVNISATSPFQLGPMTPSSFREVYAVKIKSSPSPLCSSGSFSRRSGTIKTPKNSSPMTQKFMMNYGNSPLLRACSSDLDLTQSMVTKLTTPVDFIGRKEDKDTNSCVAESVCIELLHSSRSIQESQVVTDVPSQANIPIIPVPIRKIDTDNENKEFAPIFIFDE
ncbi:protein kinase, putative, partial [Entamoeba invadens IP1]